MAADNPLTEHDIRAQLKRILESAEFANSTRLKDFLSYVVEESLAGRAGRIKGVTIAQTVFGAGQSFDPETNSIVRVEAGRLRQRLGEYYAGAGRHDPVRIGMPKGAYAPEFSPNPHDIESPAPRAETRRKDQKHRLRWPALALAALLAIILVGWLLSVRDRQTPAAVQTPHSGAPTTPTSESRILFDQAFSVLMPPEDAARMAAAQGLFERVIELEPGFAGGYSGKSLTHSIKVLFVKSGDPPRDIGQALSLASRAVELDQEDALGYSALALAHALEPDRDRTLENARLALSASRRDANSNAMAALALLVADHPKEAINLISSALRVNPDAPRMPYLNILAIAYYVNGDLAQAAQVLEENAARNGPTGPHMDVFLAATYAGLGRTFEAEAVVARLLRTAPDYPVEPWLAHFLRSDQALTEAMDRLRAAGLPSPVAEQLSGRHGSRPKAAAVDRSGLQISPDTGRWC